MVYGVGCVAIGCGSILSLASLLQAEKIINKENIIDVRDCFFND
jgi:hypothetical protein